MATHKQLKIWENSIDLVIEVYKKTKDLPDEEKFGLVSQLRRAAVSVPSNIAEGAARKSDNEFIQFLYIAMGSLSEVETQLIICKRLDYLEVDDVLNSVDQLGKSINAFIKYLKSLRK